MKTEQVWNTAYDRLYNKTKTIIRKDAYMNFYNEKEMLFLETDTSGVGLGGRLLQVREGMNFPHDEAVDRTALHLIAFTSKVVSSAETRYSNIER